MEDLFTRLDMMRDLLLHTYGLYSWQLDAEGKLLYSNCPESNFLYQLLFQKDGAQLLQESMSHAQQPVITNDSFGFLWIFLWQSEDPERFFFHLLGPFFPSQTSEAYLQNRCYQMELSLSISRMLSSLIQTLPVFSLNQSLRIAAMLHYTLTYKDISANDIIVHTPDEIPGLTEEWSDFEAHNSWEYEQNMYNSLKNGIFWKFDTPFSGRIGTLSKGDPLRQAKNEMIVFITLSRRAAVEGGMTPEGAYQLSDYYIQLTETCRDVTTVRKLSVEMHNAFVKRVQLIKHASDGPSVISAVKDYIETHIQENFTVSEMAEELGYTAYYLTRLFKKYEGVSVSSYTSQRRIERAKLLLKSPTLKTGAISSILQFSSPSYFCSLFKKYTNMTPNEYRKSPSDDFSKT